MRDPAQAQPASPAIAAPSWLLHRVAAGAPGAVRECLARYGGLVWSLARRSSPSDSDAEDAVQEIFVDLWKSAERFDPSAASETTFIAMIARRRLIDRRRKSTRRTETQSLSDDDVETLAASATSTEMGPELSAEASIAARAVLQLRPEQRKVVILSSYYGLSHEEISTSIGMPLGTVKAHCRRGLLLIRDALTLTRSAQKASAG